MYCKRIYFGRLPLWIKIRIQVAKGGFIFGKRRYSLNKKGNTICFIVALCGLAGANIALTCVYFFRVKPVSPDMLLLILTYSFLFLGCLCLLLLIKRIFHWFYRKMYRAAENAASVLQAYPATEKSAYKTVKPTIIVLFVIALICQTVNIICG